MLILYSGVFFTLLGFCFGHDDVSVVEVELVDLGGSTVFILLCLVSGLVLKIKSSNIKNHRR
jgi:hypothetical protein